jgi:hypothetical protein
MRRFRPAQSRQPMLLGPCTFRLSRQSFSYYLGDAAQIFLKAKDPEAHAPGPLSIPWVVSYSFK